MSDTEIIKLANDVYHKRQVPFYMDYYNKTFRNKVPVFRSVDEIPILYKEELLEYQDTMRLSTGRDSTCYFGEMVKDNDGIFATVNGKDGYTIQTSSSIFPENRITVPTHFQDEVDPVITDFFNEPALRRIKEDKVFIMQGGGSFMFNHSLKRTGLDDKTENMTHSIPMDADDYNKIIEKHPESDVIFFGYPQWLLQLATVGNIIKPEHYLMYMPKAQIDYSLFEKFPNRVELFVSTEVGMIAYRTTWCSNQDYHFYKHDVSMEMIYDEKCLLVTCDRPAFPLVRYFQDDRIDVKQGRCKCGFEGTTLDFLGRTYLLWA